MNVQREGLASPTRERPSRHGALLGEALATIEAAGRKEAPEVGEMCATCAYRPGCMTNQMAATGLEALKTTIGTDSAAFACHHGMKDGEPAKLCNGWLAALAAPYPVVQSAVLRLNERLASVSGPDEVREAFDRWIAEIDPDNRMDDYQRGRAFLKSPLSKETSDRTGVVPGGSING